MKTYYFTAYTVEYFTNEDGKEDMRFRNVERYDFDDATECASAFYSFDLYEHFAAYGEGAFMSRLMAYVSYGQFDEENVDERVLTRGMFEMAGK